MLKVALITGGASGIGLHVATALSKQQSPSNWAVHILDIGSAEHQKSITNINTTYHQCDITDYTSLSSIFQQIYKQHGRLDFVHANAGIIEKIDFYTCNNAPLEGDEPPPPPDMKVVDVDFKAVITTSWLALHYFRLTRKSLAQDEWEGNLIVTASVASLYAQYWSPMYTATKYSELGLVRAMAPNFYHDHRVRVNCICPGNVQTSMTAGYDIDPKYATPPANIVRAVTTLLDGKSATDDAGVTVKEGQMFGRAVEVARGTWFWRDMSPYPDEEMGSLLGDKWSVGEA